MGESLQARLAQWGTARRGWHGRQAGGDWLVVSRCVWAPYGEAGRERQNVAGIGRERNGLSRQAGTGKSWKCVARNGKVGRDAAGLEWLGA